MDLSEHLRLIYQRKWMVLGASLAVALLVFGWRTSQPQTWGGTSLIDVVSSRGQQGDTVTEQDALFISRSYAELATTQPVLARAGAAMQPPLDLPTVERRAKASSERAGYIDISTTGPTAASATQLADALSQALVDTVAARQNQETTALLQPAQAQITELENRLNELNPNDQRRETLRLQYQALVQNAAETRLRPVDRLAVVAPAHASSEPVSPRPKRDALMALLVALILNSELAVFLLRLGDRFAEEDVAAAISDEIGLPVLAEVPQGDDEQMLEAFNSLRTNLMFMQPERLRSVAVVGGESGVGKTFVAVNLAKSIGRLDVPVVLVDGDLRRPAVHERLGTTRSPGLKEMLAGNDVSARPVPDVPSLQVLPAGGPTPDPARVLVSNEFRTFLESLSWAETVVIDTPPTGPFADAVAIGLRCDAVILVVDSRRARRRQIRRVTENLRQSGVNLLGVVVNRTAPPNLQAYYRSTQEAEVSLVR
ncbi:MAG TPA: polysaccharide biosynthesis tyrosine autokinase [Acidimicrobiales bacterium]|nr:polysaccharide biosynthesis tyrosine autokinase [Acidimicrobiales bacterium]